MGNKVSTVITNVVSAANYINNKTHEVLDFLSVHLLPDRPSYRLATDNLHIPEVDMTVLMQIFNLVKDALGLVIVPFQMLNDKKFAIHVYETATIFMSPGNPMP